MTELPFQTQYDLTRRQRLIPHLKLWGPFIILAPAGVVAFPLGILWGLLPGSRHVGMQILYAVILLVWLSIFRACFVGLLDVLLHRIRHMDIIIEEKGLGFLARGDRWWFFLDGVTRVEQLMPGIWTILHRNGTVINIPAILIPEDLIEFVRAAGEHGRTPEGIQATIERGRLMQQIEQQERDERRNRRSEVN